MWPQILLLLITSQAYGGQQCPWGIYGDNCDKNCPLTCNTDPVRNLRHCQKYTGKCSEGCVPGHHGDQCNILCSRGCLHKTCNQGNGQCTIGCSGTYSGDYCNITSDVSAHAMLWTEASTSGASVTEKPADLIAIIVPIIIIIVICLVTVAVVAFILRKRKKRRKNVHGRSPEDIPLMERSGVDFSSLEHSLNEQRLEPDEVDQKINNTRTLFVETENFMKVRGMLATFHHVTISGAPGEGKTSMALMLGDRYRKQGYELVLVDDLSQVNLSDWQGHDVCVIFDDIFQKAGSHMDVPRFKHLLYDLHLYLAQCKDRSERRYESMQQESGEEERRDNQSDMYIIFTTETSALEHAQVLEGHPIWFFSNSAEASVSYTPEEKKEIWMKHKHHYKCKANVDEMELGACDKQTVGFPLVCKLFSSYAAFQEQDETFWEHPVFYLKHELDTVINRRDDHSAALILVFLCDGQLNLSQLETESDNPDLDVHIKAALSFVKTTTRQDVAEAVKSLCGSLLTEGNIATFPHSVICDVCASVLFSIEPEFTLKHCSIKFLLEHVHDDQSDLLNDQQLIIPFSEAYRGIIADRMAEFLISGDASDYIMHPLWKRKEIADRLSQMIKDLASLSHDAKHNILHYACVTGNKNTLQRLVPHCDVNRRGLNGWTPVMYAVDSGQMECFDILVKHKADIRICDSKNYTLLHLACQHGDIFTVRHVMRVLQKLNPELYLSRYLNGRAIHEWTPIMCAVLSGKKDVVDYLSKKKVDFTLRDSNNNTVLHIACQYGNISIVESLLRHIAINTRGNNGQTPVMCAVLFERKQTFHLLVLNKADISLTDGDNNSLLHVACQVQDVSLMEQIVPQFDINSRGKHGWTPVMVAAVNGIFEVFHLLLKKGADLRLTDDYNNNLLHLACHGGNVSIVKILLPKFDINSRGKYGWTAMMFAAMNGVEEVFDLLVKEGPNLTLQDVFNNSAFHLACTGGNISIVKYLLTRTDIDCRGHHGRTAIMMTALLATPKLFKVLFSGKKDYFEMRVIQEADFTLTDDYKDNVLHLACQGGSTDIVRYLLEKFDINIKGQRVIGGFDINIRGRDDQTPLMRAVCGGHMDVYMFLLSCGADQTLVDKDGHTLLHLATQHGQLRMVKYIIDSFDINAKDTAGLTPVMTSAVYNKVTVFEYLRRRGADLSLVDNAGKDVLGLAREAGCRQIIEQLEHLGPARTAKP